MTLRVPLTLTIIPALTVSIGNQHFAIPRSAIEEIVRANGESVDARAASAAPASRPSAAAACPKSRSPTSSASRATSRTRSARLVVLRPAGGDVYALAVDRIHDHEELVVKPAAPAVMATGLYAGTTLADDGSPILLFDPAGLAEVGGVKLEAQERAARIAETRRTPRSRATTPVLLFRGLDGARRAHAPGGRRPDRGSRRASAIRQAAGQLRVQLGETILPLAGAEALDKCRRQGPPVPPQRRRPRDRLRLPRGHRPDGDRA